MRWPQQAAAGGYLNLQDPFLPRYGSQRTENALGPRNYLGKPLERDVLVERTSKAEMGLGEQSENAESCRENLWNEIQLNGP